MHVIFIIWRQQERLNSWDLTFYYVQRDIMQTVIMYICIYVDALRLLRISRKGKGMHGVSLWCRAVFIHFPVVCSVMVWHGMAQRGHARTHDADLGQREQVARGAMRMYACLWNNWDSIAKVCARQPVRRWNEVNERRVVGWPFVPRHRAFIKPSRWKTRFPFSWRKTHFHFRIEQENKR